MSAIAYRLHQEISPPVKSIHRMSQTKLEELHKQLDEMFTAEPNHSSFGSPVLFVRKKDGSLQM
jgi:hypothetical protein